MKKQIEQRLQGLRTEFESGQKMLAEIEGKQTNIRNTLLRISGAIQVLEEEIAKEENTFGDRQSISPAGASENE